MRHFDIAMALGITRETLAKHYQAELSAVAAMRRLEMKCALHAAAKRGNVSAARAYLAEEPELAVPPLAAGEEAPVPVHLAVDAKAEKLGKKEQAQADAVTAAAGTEWADLLRTGPAPLQ